MVTTTPFGMTPDGHTAHVYELACGPVRVRVSDFGATLLGIDAPDAQGRIDDILLGFGSIEGYFDNPACYGATIGPSANRTDLGQVPLGGTVYQLPLNDGPDKRNNLHSDLEHGLHKRLWEARLDDGTEAVTFTCRLDAGELGLPGARTFTARFELGPANGDGAELTVRYGCTADAATFVNMTNHSYFNLAGHASGTALEQLVRIEAGSYLPQRPDSVSAGEVAPVAGTPFDFRSMKALGADIDADDTQLTQARGFDHCLCIDGWEPQAGPRQALHAEDAASGRTLDILITAPGAHLYTANWLDDADAKDGARYRPHDGFAFEPEFWPDCVHHPAWPQPVCTPDEPFASCIVYRFGTR